MITRAKFVYKDCSVHVADLEMDKNFYVYVHESSFCNAMYFDNLTDALDCFNHVVMKILKEDAGYSVIRVRRGLDVIKTDRTLPELSNVETAFNDFCDYLDDCGVGELYRKQLGGDQ